MSEVAWYFKGCRGDVRVVEGNLVVDIDQERVPLGFDDAGSVNLRAVDPPIRLQFTPEDLMAIQELTSQLLLDRTPPTFATRLRARVEGWSVTKLLTSWGRRDCP